MSVAEKKVYQQIGKKRKRDKKKRVGKEEEEKTKGCLGVHHPN